MVNIVIYCLIVHLSEDSETRVAMSKDPLSIDPKHGLVLTVPDVQKLTVKIFKYLTIYTF